ncbi:MAG: hypothetical protein K9G31_03220 [Crocinitomicaceae bacterium]|nr:hypothetical protein [Crocinitomicaceae bacterium]
MAFNGDEGTVVTLADASRWTANYRRTIPAGEIIGQFFGKNQLIKILNQKGCMGIRFYYGIGNDGKKNIIAVGAGSDENDMVDGIILEYALKCPPHCSVNNSLNS